MLQIEIDQDSEQFIVTYSDGTIKCVDVEAFLDWVEVQGLTKQ